jgi:hypothetical protein
MAATGPGLKPDMVAPIAAVVIGSGSSRFYATSFSDARAAQRSINQ